MSMQTLKLKQELKTKKITLPKLSKDFNDRHDFESEDLDLLKDKFKNIRFKNIPEAWIILIDKMIYKAGPENFNAIEQHCGFLVVDCDEKSKKIVDLYEKRLYLIDKDLHDRLNI